MGKSSADNIFLNLLSGACPRIQHVAHVVNQTGHASTLRGLSEPIHTHRPVHLPRL